MNWEDIKRVKRIGDCVAVAGIALELMAILVALAGYAFASVFVFAAGAILLFVGMAYNFSVSGMDLAPDSYWDGVFTFKREDGSSYQTMYGMDGEYRMQEKRRREKDE